MEIQHDLLADRQTHSSDQSSKQVIAPWKSVSWKHSLPFSKGLCPSWKAQTWLLSLLPNLLTVYGLSCFWAYSGKIWKEQAWYCNMPDPQLLCLVLSQCPRDDQGQMQGQQEDTRDSMRSWSRWALHCLSAGGLKMTFCDMFGGCFPG